MLVAACPSNSIILIFAAYCFLLLLNPLNILCTLAGIGMYIIVCTKGFICVTVVNSWGIIICLAVGVTNSVLAVLQSTRIYRSMVRYI